ncbi:cytochrome b [Dyella sp. RRB7]|uniref:cytochrome b n=1 Tax=Dyella sp. RRB7 TaxID=2919502 RepID=UPI001FA9820B|nr:cytochrome b [Dyella sp. RRB7]
MSLRSNDRQWGSVAKFFHWTTALLIIGNGIFGLAMDLASSPMQKINWLALHKSIGLTVLALLLLRLLWRVGDRRPKDEPAPRWQTIVAHAVHGVLYLLIAALPLSGWWFNSIAGKPLQFFKLFNLPALTTAHPELRHFAHGVHEKLFWILVVILVLHVAGAWKHHLLDRDNTLLRMLPFRRLRNGSASQGER